MSVRASGYDGLMARVYDKAYSANARAWAPLVRSFHESRPEASGLPRNMLDLCCGNGVLLRHFAEQGYQCFGVDLSQSMLDRGAKSLASVGERVTLVCSDVTDFELPGQPRIGLAVSTMDSLNHLPGEADLGSCFKLVSGMLCPGGLFVFDLLTKQGLADANNSGTTVLPDSVVVSRGVYLEDAGASHSRVTGFLRRSDGLYERFDMNTNRCEFAPDRVRDLLAEAGFTDVHLADVADLATPLAGPDGHDRVFYVATR
jgi:SAM-dependent methyltransferase